MAGRKIFKPFLSIGAVTPFEIVTDYNYVKTKETFPRIRVWVPAIKAWNIYDVLGITTNFEEETITYRVRYVNRKEAGGQEAQHEAPAEPESLPGATGGEGSGADASDEVDRDAPGADPQGSGSGAAVQLEDGQDA